MQLEALIIDDVANHVVQAVKNVESKVESDLNLLSTATFVCAGEESEKWEYGTLVQNEILNVSFKILIGFLL